MTLIQGEFDRGNRPKPKNVEVGISVCDEDCNVLKVGHTSEQDEKFHKTYSGSCFLQLIEEVDYLSKKTFFLSFYLHYHMFTIGLPLN